MGRAGTRSGRLLGAGLTQLEAIASTRLSSLVAVGILTSEAGLGRPVSPLTDRRADSAAAVGARIVIDQRADTPGRAEPIIRP
jgi:hypothetical protein